MKIIRLERRRFFSRGFIQGGRRRGPVAIAKSDKSAIDGGFKRCRSQYKKQRQDEGHAVPVYDEVLAKTLVKNTVGRCEIMTATFINGIKISEDIKREVAAEVESLKRRGIQPGLAVVLVGDDAASSAYVNMKARTCEQLGIYSRKLTIPSVVTTEQLLGEVGKLNEDDSIDGILVQIPLPKHVNKHAVLESVDPTKDVDGFHSANLGSLVLGHETLVACTPSGVMELLHRSNVTLEGANAVVLGRSDDVGKPQALLLMHANATVTICHSKTRNLREITRQADIIVAAIGKTALVTRDWVKPGAVVIDVGTNKVSDRAKVQQLFGNDDARLKDFEKRGYIWVGDVDERAVKEVASMITPVPGGVGPMTIATLMKNTIKAARMRRGL
jgi:methylenetetrahydrofolate dehydrogenase (NADP+) / methenyltetrahydrofolate cyclohydrolase